MFMGQHIKRWKIAVLAGSVPLLQLGTCTTDEQEFWRSVQAAGETLVTGLVSAIFVAIQNNDGDDVVGVDTAAWAFKHLVGGLF